MRETEGFCFPGQSGIFLEISCDESLHERTQKLNILLILQGMFRFVATHIKYLKKKSLCVYDRTVQIRDIGAEAER